MKQIKDQIITVLFVIILSVVWVAILMICLTIDARATEIEIEIGRSLYVNGHDDWWYQQGMQHQLEYHATTFEIGIHDEIVSSGNLKFNYGLSWNYLGQMGMQSMAVADSDYSIPNHHCIAPCGHQSDFIGSGHDQGFSLALEPSYRGFGLIAGAYLHRNAFSERIEDFGGNDVAPGCGRLFQIKDTLGWTLGKVIGMSYTSNNVVIKYQYFVNPDHFLHVNVNSENFPAAWHGTHVLSIGYVF